MGLTEAMAWRGYTLGENLEIKAYGVDTYLARLLQLARDIVASESDAVLIVGWPPAAAIF